LALANPLSDEQPLLRTTLLPGLFGAINRNTSRGFTDVSLFEIASVTLPSADQSSTGGTNPPRPSVAGRPSEADLAALEKLLPEQPLYAAAVLTNASWSDAVEIALSLGTEIGVQLTVQKADIAPWHPGRCAQLVINSQVVGTAGELAPRVVEKVGLPKRSVAFEIDLSALMASANVTPSAPRIWTFPIVKEDLALVVKKEIAAADLMQSVTDAAGELLEDIKLFDVYEGNQVPEGHKSVAFALRFRASDRTLSADEVQAVRQTVLAAVNEKFGATLRS
jgi:phenylalanyl-tRNA synthetase beta chain